MSTLKSQAKSALIWDFSGKIARNGMGFVVSIFLARLLEPSEFGLIAMVMVVIGIAQIFTDVGLGGALIQRRKVLPIHYSSVFYFNLAVAVLLACATYASAKQIGDFYDNPELIPLAEVLSVSFVIYALSSVQNIRLRKDLNYALPTKIALFASLVSGIIGISLAFMGAGVWSLVAQQLSQGIVYNIVIWNKAQWRPDRRFSWRALRQLWVYGFRMFLSGFLEAIFSRLDALIIGKLFDAATLGLFQRAKSLNEFVIKYSSGSLMSVLFPVLSKIQRDLPKFQNIVLKSYGIIAFVTFLLLGLLYVLSQELIVLLYGERWLLSVEYFKILALSGFAYPLSALLVNVLSSRGNSKAFLRLEIYKKIIFSINFPIGFMWGIEGFLYGLAVASAVAVYVNICFVSWEIRLEKSLFVMPVMIQATITVLCAVAIEYLFAQTHWSAFVSLVSKGVLFGGLYMSMNHLFKPRAYGDFREQMTPFYVKLSARIKK